MPKAAFSFVNSGMLAVHLIPVTSPYPLPLINFFDVSSMYYYLFNYFVFTTHSYYSYIGNYMHDIDGSLINYMKVSDLLINSLMLHSLILHFA